LKSIFKLVLCVAGESVAAVDDIMEIRKRLRKIGQIVGGALRIGSTIGTWGSRFVVI